MHRQGRPNYGQGRPGGPQPVRQSQIDFLQAQAAQREAAAAKRQQEEMAVQTARQMAARQSIFGKMQENEKGNKGFINYLSSLANQYSPQSMTFPHIMQMLGQQKGQRYIPEIEQPDEIEEVLKNFNPKRFGFGEYYQDEGEGYE